MANLGFEQTSARPPPAAGPREARPAPARIRRPPAARAAMAHGAYLLGVGLWPLVAIRTFEKVTGPRLERWLAKGVGVCLANIGGALAMAGARGKVTRELRVLGVTTGLTLAALDVWYAGIRRRISPVYLASAAAHLAFAGIWGLAEWRESLDTRRPPEAAFA